MSKNYKGHKFIFAQSNESDDKQMNYDNDKGSPQGCKTCGKSNHPTEKCFKTLKCENCNIAGHNDKYCRQPKVCKTCGKGNHVPANIKTAGGYTASIYDELRWSWAELRSPDSMSVLAV